MSPRDADSEASLSRQVVSAEFLVESTRMRVVRARAAFDRVTERLATAVAAGGDKETREVLELEATKRKAELKWFESALTTCTNDLHRVQARRYTRLISKVRRP